METHLSQDLQEFLNKISTKNFLSAVRQFIDLIEDPNTDKNLFVSNLHAALAQVYSAGILLESIELKYSDENSDFDRDALFENKNAGMIRENDAFYWQVSDPTYSLTNGQAEARLPPSHDLRLPRFSHF